jgi:hypothetical protein
MDPLLSQIKDILVLEEWCNNSKSNIIVRAVCPWISPLVDEMDDGHPSMGPCPEMNFIGFSKSVIFPLDKVQAWVVDWCLIEASLEPNKVFPFDCISEIVVPPSSGGNMTEPQMRRKAGSSVWKCSINDSGVFDGRYLWQLMFDSPTNFMPSRVYSASIGMTCEGVKGWSVMYFNVVKQGCGCSASMFSRFEEGFVEFFSFVEDIWDGMIEHGNTVARRCWCIPRE